MKSSFPVVLLVFGTLYAAYGTESPFLPSFLGERGLSPGEIGIVLAAGRLVRLGTAPLAGHLADRHDATRPILGMAAAAAGLVSFGYLAGYGFWPILLVGMAHSVAAAALAPLADALALRVAAREKTFAYGWVRGAGSGAFILGTLLSGQLVAQAGLTSIIASSGILFLAMALAAIRLPVVPRGTIDPTLRSAGIASLLADPLFRRVLLVAALVIGSHALHDGFAVIRWREAGLAPGTIGLLWSEAVASEVVVFVLVGPWLLKRLDAPRAALLAAAAGVARWSVMALTTSVPILALSQLTHGLTFAFLHLAIMRLIAEIVPEHLTATGLTLYGTGIGIASVLLTLASGALYAHLGADAFWVMAVLCLAAMPVAMTLGSPALRSPTLRRSASDGA